MNSSLRVLRFTIFIILVLANLSQVRYSAMVFEDGALHTVTPRFEENGGAVLSPAQQIANDVGEFCIQRDGSGVKLTACDPQAGAVLWVSPEDWIVKEAFFSDLNHDNEPELALLVWRPFKPWPVDNFMPDGGRISTFHDRDGYSCQLILIRLEDGKHDQLWAGSALADPMHSLLAADLDGDGEQELAGIEYVYDDKSRSGSIVVWKWNGFGFSLADREDGLYSSLQAIRINETITLIALQN